MGGADFASSWILVPTAVTTLPTFASNSYTLTTNNLQSHFVTRYISADTATITTGAAVGGATAGAGGLAFPATAVAVANANTLDDYEEGTFTPSFNTTNSDLTGFSHDTQTGSYVKIGTQVTVSIELSTTNALSITGTGIVRVTGLPFLLAQVANGGRNVLALTHDTRWATNPSFGQIQGSDTAIKLYKNNAMSSGASLAVSDFSATNSSNFNIVTFMFTYITT